MSQPSAFKHITGFAAESSDCSVFIHEITHFLKWSCFLWKWSFFFLPHSIFIWILYLIHTTLIGRINCSASKTKPLDRFTFLKQFIAVCFNGSVRWALGMRWYFHIWPKHCLYHVPLLLLCYPGGHQQDLSSNLRLVLLKVSSCQKWVFHCHCCLLEGQALGYCEASREKLCVWTVLFLYWKSVCSSFSFPYL